MDRAGPRHLLDQSGFDLVIDCGIGGTAANFDSITMNVLPNNRVTATELWPPDDEETKVRRTQEVERLAAARRVYRTISDHQGCGHVALAGRSIAVPFVGVVSSGLALSELLRRLMGATRFDRLRLHLASPEETSTSISEGEGHQLRAPFQAAVGQPSSRL
jgi:hypothetical protein